MLSKDEQAYLERAKKWLPKAEEMYAVQRYELNEAANRIEQTKRRITILEAKAKEQAMDAEKGAK